MHVFLQCSLAVWAVATSLAQIPADTTQKYADSLELSRLETVWNEAYVRGDADLLDSLCADDLVVTMTNMQVLNKASAIQILRSGRVRFQRYESSDIGIRVYVNAAVVTGRLQRTRMAQGREVNDDWRFTKVYFRRNGRWQVIAWHASTTAP